MISDTSKGKERQIGQRYREREKQKDRTNGKQIHRENRGLGREIDSDTKTENDIKIDKQTEIGQQYRDREKQRYRQRYKDRE